MTRDGVALVRHLQFAGLVLVLALMAGCAGGAGITPVRTAFNRGVYFQSRGDLDQAIAEYQAALDEDDSDYRARFNLGTAYDAKGRIARDRGDTAGAARWREAASAEYRRVLEQRPEELRAIVNLAACEYEGGDTSSGEARLRDALRRHPESILPRTALAARLLALATAGGDDSSLAEARELAESALRRRPESLTANTLLGLVQMESARRAPEGSEAARAALETARKALERAIERRPGDVATLLILGRLELQLSNQDGARVWLERLLYIDPDHVGALQLLAGVYEAQGRLEDAVYRLWRARASDPDPEAAAKYQSRLAPLYQRLLDAAK